jgi:hypothetical protein
MPAFVLHYLAGELADDLLLSGQRVLPDKAEASGFKFRHATLRSALSAMLGVKAASARGEEFSHAPALQDVPSSAPAE